MLADALTVLGAAAFTVGLGLALGFVWAVIAGGVLLFLAGRALA
jgi:hypothetical protein